MTSYAFGFIEKQLKFVGSVQELVEMEDHWIVETSSGRHTVTPTKCTCIFFQSIKLPCRHLSALQQKLCLPLFDTSLCDKRWSSEYYQSTQRLFITSDSSKPILDQPSVTTTSTKEDIKILSQHEKFRKASFIATEVASIVSYSSRCQFVRRIELLQKISEFWRDGKEVSVVPLEGQLSNYMYMYILCRENVKILVCTVHYNVHVHTSDLWLF